MTKANKNLKTFKDYSNLERKAIINLCNNVDGIELRKITDPNGFSPYDCTIASGDTVVLVTELKNRKIESTRYNDAVLETNKIQNILNKCDEMAPIADELGIQLVPFYIAFYTDGQAIGWPLTGQENTSIMLAPKYTAVGGYNNDLIEKQFSHFNIKDGIRFS